MELALEHLVLVTVVNFAAQTLANTYSGICHSWIVMMQ